MVPIYTVLIVLLIVLPLFWALHYFGFLVTRMGVSILSVYTSLPTHWEGHFDSSTLFLRRNFVTWGKYQMLSIQSDAEVGTIEFEVKTPNGNILSPAYSTNDSTLFDVSGLKRCSVTLQMDHFRGSFFITLQ